MFVYPGNFRRGNNEKAVALSLNKKLGTSIELVISVSLRLIMERFKG